MAEMFCFQCQQTAGGSGCVRTGVCGKQPETAQLQDALLDKLVRLAQACERKGWRPDEVTELLTDGLFITLTNVNFDDGAIRAFTQRIDEMLAWVDAPKPEKDPGWLWRGETDLVSLRSTLLFGLKGMAAYATTPESWAIPTAQWTPGFTRVLRRWPSPIASRNGWNSSWSLAGSISNVWPCWTRPTRRRSDIPSPRG